MNKEFTIVTAVTPEYKTLLFWAMSSWVYKPQLRNRPLIVFYNGMRARDLKFVLTLFPSARLIEWNMENTHSKSELMFSSFVFGAAQHVTTPYYMKLDADSYCTNDKDVWVEGDFQYDIIGHRWNYTKPGWFIQALENHYTGKEFLTPPEDNNIKRHKRFESYCCLHRTEWVKSVVPMLNNKLPVPSHDTTLWFYADKMGKWGAKNIKACGVTTTNKWKKIREDLCRGDIAFNPLLNVELLSHAQLEITSRCNLSCTQCDRNCGVVPPGPDLDLYQIWNFISASIYANHFWKRIDIIGGEPTLHKSLDSIFEIIKIYKDKYPKCRVRISTNGHGDHVNKVIETIPDWVHIRNSSKESKDQPHDGYRYAPIDSGETEVSSCSVPWRCGIALTRYGYFPCGAGASLARVFGLDIGIKSFKEVTPAALKKQMLQLCRYCGHSNCESRKTLAGDNGMSESWKKAIENYNINNMSEI